ncbi:hypothetical protein P7F88_25525 [Vibrio hannami]|uniref:hypothetical protein n=1 Tax=Vibrio hannami TaxID=2717094 RepID=UPI0024106472|nr:hypothetical protein [Vibrio hannami]MDG3089227.1 hypothetical protein [Vibrio hannami]
MPYYVVSNFASGRDLRRSTETTPSGSLFVLRNAFINEGGQIEKRKAWVMQEALTAYGQDPRFKGKIAGPFSSPFQDNSVVFRHQGDDMPSQNFTAETTTTAVTVDKDVNTGRSLQSIWVQASTQPIAGNAALLHVVSAYPYGDNAYILEAYLDPSTFDWVFQHTYLSFSEETPNAEVSVSDNNGREFQRVLRNKGYVVKNRTLYASAVGAPQDMSGAGSWVIDITTQGMPIGAGVALADYFGQLVVMGARGMQFWQVDPDPALNQYLRTVDDAILAARSVTGYGSGDLLYLNNSGIRSLQARDSSNLARVSDIGSPIDRDIRAKLQADDGDAEALFAASSPEYSNSLFHHLATGSIHKQTGQFWLALRNEVHVLARYPSAGVQAWSTFDLPFPQNAAPISGDVKGQWVADWCEVNDSIIMRNFADEVYTYGGPGGDAYDDAQVEVIIPFMDFERPGSIKQFTGIDLVCDGSWAVDFTTDFHGNERNLHWERLADVHGSTRSMDRIDFSASGTHLALRLTTSDQFAASLSEILVHYETGRQK